MVPTGGFGALGGGTPSDRPRVIGLTVVAGAFVVSRVVYLACGVRFDSSPLHPSATSGNQEQLLSLSLLTHQLVPSLWYLHSQPPLYELYCGLLLHLPPAARTPVAAASFWVLGLAMVACTYLLLVELGSPLWLAVAAALVVVVDPANILYENWLSWSYPTAALLTVGTYCCARYLRTRRAGWGAGCIACFAAVVLEDSTFQIVWLLAVAALLLVFLWRHRRQVLVAAVVPLLVVTAWYAKDAAVFGTYTTSSWMGMNLATTTVVPASPQLVHRLVRQGRLTPLALKSPFWPVGYYMPRYATPAHTGVPALDQRRKPDGKANLDNLAYIRISSEYLHDDLAFVAAAPGAYLHAVGVGARIWMVPPEQYAFLDSNLRHVAGYDRAYDEIADWQTQRFPPWQLFYAMELGIPPPLADLSLLALAEMALVLLAAPVMVVLRRRERVVAGTVAVAVCTIGYSFVLTSMVSLGENERFRYELGSLPMVVAVTVVVWVARAARRRLNSRARATSETADLGQA